ncbi:choline-sulfatase [Lacisediminimonas sp.]|uniref:choline-sulfatase n=1 Tax=Lacisediminimonas sp. TaxID=3060582 RepID=UPI00271FB4DA|nr:choline-sulfatase [Lacisediminimonas sp.]MDO8299153.1 choline-sulfatase [Lacisediminimonas sp.]
MQKRMNILHIMADQLTAFGLRSYGNPVCKTPNIDALIARGTLFENAYSNFPICAPARTAMLSGQLSTRVGVYDNACEFAPSVPTLPYYMSALGYHTCLAGKMHFVGPDQMHGYQERLTTDIYPSDFGWTPNWKLAIPVGPMGLNLRSVVESGVCRRSLQLDYDDDVGHKSVQRLYDYGRDPDSRPFFFTVSFTHPHNPYVTTQEYWDRYRDDEIDDPHVGPIPTAQMDPHSKRLHSIYRYDEYDVQREDVLRARHAYYGMISYVDDQVGKLLGALRDMDMEDNTVVIFTADHGDMLGERGLWYKWNLFEWSMRIPMIVAVPGQEARRVATPVSLLDLLPTCVDIGRDAEHPMTMVSPVEGASLLPDATGTGQLPADRPVYGETTADGTTSPCLMVRKGPWKMIHCPLDPPQLFRLDQDPQETRNLAGQADSAVAEQELLALVNQNWNVAQLTRDVIRSSEQRIFIQNTRLQRNYASWDYEPRKDPSKQYVRSGSNVSATLVKGRARYPFVPAKTPDRKI